MYQINILLIIDKVYARFNYQHEIFNPVNEFAIIGIKT